MANLKKPSIMDTFVFENDKPEQPRTVSDPVSGRAGHIKQKIQPLQSMGHIESRRDNRKVRMTAYVERDVYEELRAYCVRTGRSAGDLITIWLRHDLHSEDYNK